MSRRRSPITPIELDTMPFAGMMLLLIPMLLASAQFVSLATVDAALPAIISTHNPIEETPLRLTVGVHALGFTLSASEEGRAAMGWDEVHQVPLASDGHDYAALTELVAGIKTQFPSDQGVIITPDEAVPFHTLVATMDATRDLDGRELFPDVVFASIVN